MINAMNNPKHQTSDSISHCLLLKLSQSLGADEEKRKLLQRSLIISTLFAFWLKMKQVDEFSFKSVKTFDKTFLTFTTFPPNNMDVLKALKLFDIIKFFPPLQTRAPPTTSSSQQRGPTKLQKSDLPRGILFH